MNRPVFIDAAWAREQSRTESGDRYCAGCLPATIAWSATEADAYGEPPLADAFCVQLVVLNGERHVYRLHRKVLTQLHRRLSRILDGSSTAGNAAV
ncbi:MAG TPA: hypothetical protein VEK73_11235 [Xanthobacteraceae bacterium]|nr:hypothetical protein [Xanthobacteraceae bacterium]